MELKPGQVVVSSVDRTSIISRIISWATRSKYTHAFIITGPDEAVEAWFPKVRTFNYRKRLEELERQGREYIVLDYPRLDEYLRDKIANKARSFVGRWYDIGQALLFLFTGRFWNDGSGTLICFRTVTAAYFEGAGISLIPVDMIPKNHPRRQNLLRGAVLAQDLLRSRLVEVYRHR